jgi:protein-disulfide isomerase
MWALLVISTVAMTASSLLRTRTDGAHAAAELQAQDAAQVDRAAQRMRSGRLAGVGSTLSLLRGIPQNGVTLGDPNAPVELVEFADLQCPYCAAAGTVLLPSIIQKYVRTGQVKLTFRNLAFLGPDSVAAARAAASMARQNHLWDFVELFFDNQGPEGSGYVTDAFVQKLISAVPGVDAQRAMAERSDPAVGAAVAQAQAEADRLDVQGTPAFFLVKPGRKPVPLDPASLLPDAFARALK